MFFELFGVAFSVEDLRLLGFGAVRVSSFSIQSLSGSGFGLFRV